MKTPESGADTNVLRKTPEEIKKGLAKCSADRSACDGCEFSNGNVGKWRKLMGYALAYIQQLEAGIDHAEKVARECAKSITENLDKLQAKLIQVERERDAAVHDMENYAGYGAICKHFDNDCPHIVEGCPLWPSDCESYEWRGVCEENTKEK